jgi:hypothetical protein
VFGKRLSILSETIKHNRAKSFGGSQYRSQTGVYLISLTPLRCWHPQFSILICVAIAYEMCRVVATTYCRQPSATNRFTNRFFTI